MSLAALFPIGRFRRQILFALTLAMTGTALEAQQNARDERASHRVIVDRRPVSTAGVQTLLELVARHPRALRIGITSTDPARQPLIVVDGNPLVGGVDRLGSIPAINVDSVTVLTPHDATLRYGGPGWNGALIVRTRQGGLPGRDTWMPGSTHPGVR